MLTSRKTIDLPIDSFEANCSPLQLSYADTHPMFTSNSFPNFFRVVPSENAFNAPRVALLIHFNWTRVGTIYQNEPRYALVSSFDSKARSYRLVPEPGLFRSFPGAQSSGRRSGRQQNGSGGDAKFRHGGELRPREAEGKGR